MVQNPINIFGSCVTRDAIEFGSGLSVGKYCARQSIVSSVAAPPSEETISALEFVNGTHPFHQRLVQEDFGKTTLAQLAERPQNEILVIDFIEERMPLGITKCGALVSFSQAASKFSNARTLLARRIEPYSDEHIELFKQSLDSFAARLNGRTVFIHRVLYAVGDWEFQRANETLDLFYSLAASTLKPFATIDVPLEFRLPSVNHKWGFAPYHYVDGYYKNFVEQLSTRANRPILPKADFTLQT